MLRNEEKKHITEILKFIPEVNLMQLAMTITLNKLVPKSVEEAVQLILMYESSFQSFLQHKKVSCEVLFQYMHNQKIPVLPNADKKTMIIKIIEHVNQLQSPVVLSSKGEANQCQNQQSEVSNEPLEQQQQILSVSASERNLISLQHRYTGDVNDLALEFSKWFYSMMNQESCISTEHFWTDCSTQLHLLDSKNTMEHTLVKSAEESVKLLWEMKTQHRLYFNPNITSGGVRGIVEMHGLVMVLVCGSLHQEEKCVGIFEQKFGLIRDPTASNNWKIKFTELFLRSTCTVQGLPTLQDCNLINNSSIIAYNAHVQ